MEGENFLNGALEGLRQGRFFYTAVAPEAYGGDPDARPAECLEP